MAWVLFVRGGGIAASGEEGRLTGQEEHTLRRIAWLAWGSAEWMGIAPKPSIAHVLYRDAMLGEGRLLAADSVKRRIQRAAVLVVGDMHGVRYPKEVVASVWELAGDASGRHTLALEYLDGAVDSHGQHSGLYRECDPKTVTAELRAASDEDAEYLLPTVLRAMQSAGRIVALGGPSSPQFEGMARSGRERRVYPVGRSLVDQSLGRLVIDRLRDASEERTLAVVGLGHAYVIAENFRPQLESGEVVIVVPMDPLLECAWARRLPGRESDWIEIAPGIIQAPRVGGISRVGDLSALLRRFEASGSRAVLGDVAIEFVLAVLRDPETRDGTVDPVPLIRAPWLHQIGTDVAVGFLLRHAQREYPVLPRLHALERLSESVAIDAARQALESMASDVGERPSVRIKAASALMNTLEPRDDYVEWMAGALEQTLDTRDPYLPPDAVGVVGAYGVRAARALPQLRRIAALDGIEAADRARRAIDEIERAERRARGRVPVRAIDPGSGHR